MAAQIIGRYSVFEEIAAGGMASVHLGRLRAEGGFSRTVAIKRLHPQYARDPDFVTMFLDEARLASRIRHPNVVTTLDVLSEGNEVLLVMEYVAGESLSRLMRASRPGALPVPVSLAIMTAVLHGLHAAHIATTEQGAPLELVHRDVSPQNILVGVDGIARVLDFGVAKAAHRAQTTKEGQLKGKLSYMPPEQMRRDAMDRRSDVYAASVVLWECLTGERLFEADSEARVVTRVLNEEVRPPSQLVPGISSALDAVVLRGLEREPDARFSTAREMAIALERCGIPHAPMSEVGECVERLAAASLTHRAERITEIERASDQGLTVAPSMRQPTMPTIVDPDPLPSRTPYATSASLAGLPPPPRRGRIVVMALVALCIVATLAIVITTRTRVVGPTPAAAPPPSAEPAPPAPVLSAAPVPIAPSAATSAPPVATAVVAAPTKPKPVQPASPAAAPKGDRCKPPYTIDEGGIRHLKPECL